VFSLRERMKLIVGLGNPGSKHARQRHNVGFMALDAIMARHHIGPARKRFQSEAAEGRIGQVQVLAIKPQTFMNESGRAVGEAARFYRLGIEDIIVLHDEIDLAAGKVRVKRGGGNAGHNGLKSLAAHLGSDFTRVRIGIGHPGSKELVQRHVLGDFAKADAAWLVPLLDAVADHAERLVTGDEANFMNALADAGRGAAQDGTRRTPPAKERPPRAHRARASADSPKQPSQRELARAAAQADRKRAGTARRPPRDNPTAPESAAENGATGDDAHGPFARLRRLLFGAQGPGRT
jgi:PTH1 family peptidyl-tRNA hydrolase